MKNKIFYFIFSVVGLASAAVGFGGMIIIILIKTGVIK